MTRLTPVDAEQAKESVKDTLDELAARRAERPHRQLNLVAGIEPADQRQRCLSAA
jgi:hypothetical protein